MANLWNRFERQLEIHAPGLAASLRAGINEIALAAFEEEIGQRLPDDVREAYLHHDGCDYDGDRNSIGLFGRIQWRPINKLLAAWRWNSGSFDEDDPYFYGPEDGEWERLPIRPWQCSPPQWIPIGECIGDARFVYIDLLPGPLGTPGQLVIESVHSMSKGILARSFHDYVSYLAEGLESEAIRMDLIPATQLRVWTCSDGANFAPPGSMNVW